MEKIKEWVLNKKSFHGDGDGSGSGYGNGNGYGNGSGNGNGNGYGNGNGNGSGDKSGFGNGNGDRSGNGNGSGDKSGFGSRSGVKSINNHIVYKIDNINTIIYSIRNDIARGATINEDLTFTDCYITKSDKFFAHGSSIKEAMKSLQDKKLLDSPIEDRIKAFILEFPLFGKKYKANDLFDWHYKLTGSCKFGRQSFIDNNNIDLKKDKFTINEFIKLTKDEYNGDIIKQLILSK